MKRIILNGFLLALLGGSFPEAWGNMTGHPTQNFNPLPGNGDFVTVHSSETLPAGKFNVGLFANGAVNSLPYRDSSTQSRSRINDILIGFDGLFAAGILPNLELGVGLPFIGHQSIRDDKTRGEFEHRGNLAVRSMAKLRFWRQQNFGAAVVAGATFNRTANDPHTGQGAPLSYQVEMVADATIGDLIVGFNLGHQWHAPGEPIEDSLFDPIGNKLLASAALSYELTQKTALVTEIYGSRPTESVANRSDRSLTSAENSIGARHKLDPSTSVHIGAGTELQHGLSTPDWRLYTGIIKTIGNENERKARKRARQPKPIHEFPEPAQEPFNIPIPTEEPDKVFVIRNVNFEFDSDYRVLEGAIDNLRQLATYLQSTNFKKVLIEGHTDYLGSKEYNDDLSFRRAKSVRRHLIRHYQMDPNTLIAVGYGKSRPLTDDPSDHGRQLNRRVEVKIFYK